MTTTTRTSYQTLAIHVFSSSSVSKLNDALFLFALSTDIVLDRFMLSVCYRLYCACRWQQDLVLGKFTCLEQPK